MSYTRNLYNVLCQLYLKQIGGGGAKKPKVQLYQMKKPFQVHVLNHGPLNRVS